MWPGHIALPLTGSHPDIYSSSSSISKKSWTFIRALFKHVKFSESIMLFDKLSFCPKKKGMINTGNPANTHFSLKDFKHLNNFCKILPFWVLNLMLEFLIKFTHQISAVIDCFFSIIVHILIIEKDLNCLLNLNTLLCFSQCRKGHTHLKFHKFIICSATRTGSSMPLLIIATIIFSSKVPSVISLISCITHTVLASVFNSVMERRDLKASLALI